MRERIDDEWARPLELGTGGSLAVADGVIAPLLGWGGAGADDVGSGERGGR